MKLMTTGLTKKYGQKTVVNNLNLEIPSQSLVAFLGHNGAGKSTTISMLIGLLKPTSGRINFLDDHNQQCHPKIGVVFQNSILDDELTVKENLSFRAIMQGKKSVSNLEKVAKVLGLNNFINQKYGSLSGGQRRRVDIARALLNDPDFLFLDEPTTGLDIQTRTVIWQLLNDLRKKNNLTIFLTTHYLEEAQDANLVYIVNQGDIIAQGSAQSIIAENTQNYLEIKISATLSFPVNSEEIAQNQYRIIDIPVQDAINFLAQNRTVIEHFEYHRGTFDDAFMNLTGKELQ
ncbi:Zinc ABC transporter ATP-binding protein ZnuC [Lactiplantibacillus plantarum]|nr:Zinc ABC transporter ATP-binding protein ZnuC [Lactiplantibacillus plantarum]